MHPAEKAIIQGRALERALIDEAYELGRKTADLLANPFPDGSIHARRFVDGWVDGRLWAQS